jgi:selenocysteine lyase/cysteine desulfurase
MITFSHISNVSGLALPAREICRMAKAKGILTLVDGAQSLGFMDLNLQNMGCDFYTSSTHKWLMGPMENGILYVSKAQMEKLWPNIIGAGW